MYMTSDWLQQIIKNKFKKTTHLINQNTQLISVYYMLFIQCKTDVTSRKNFKTYKKRCNEDQMFNWFNIFDGSFRKLILIYPKKHSLIKSLNMLGKNNFYNQIVFNISIISYFSF